MFIKKTKLLAACLIPLALAAGGTALWFHHAGTHDGGSALAMEASKSEERGTSISSSGSESSPPQYTGKKFKLIVSGQTWEDVIEWFADISGLTYAEGSAKPTGKVALVPPKGNQEFTLPEIVDLLNESLASRKASERCMLIRRNFTFTFVPADEIVDPNIPRKVTEDQLVEHGHTEVVKMIIPLKKFVAAEVATRLKPLKSSFGQIAAIPSNSLFIVDTVGVIRGNILPAIREDRAAAPDIDQYTHTCKYVAALKAKRRLFDLMPQDTNKNAERRLKISIDDEREQVTVSGPAELVARAKAVLYDCDKPEGGGK